AQGPRSCSGGDDLEDDAALPRRLVSDLVRLENLVGRNGSARLVTREHLGEDVSRGDLVPVLLVADNADRVVDRVVLVATPGAEVKRRVADLNGPHRANVAGL